MPISETGTERGHSDAGASDVARGFSLIELMVVMAILAVTAAVVPFAASRMFEAMEYRATVREVVSGLRAARLDAIRKGRSSVYVFDLEERRFGPADGRGAAIPKSIRFNLTVADIEAGDRRGVIRFYPDGSATGGDIELIRASGDGVRISVDWLLGRMTQRSIPG